MPYSPGSVTVDPNGQTAVVTITLPGGAAPIAYDSKGGSGTIALPATISAVTRFYFAEQTQLTVSVKVGGVEVASPSGAAVVVDLSGGGNGRVTASTDSPYPQTLARDTEVTAATGTLLADLTDRTNETSETVPAGSTTNSSTAGITKTAPALLNPVGAVPQRFAVKNNSTGTITVAYPDYLGNAQSLTILSGEAHTFRQKTLLGWGSESNKPLSALDGRFEQLGRDALAFYLDVTAMADGALTGTAAQVGGNVQTSGTQPTTIASGKASGPATGTSYLAPSTLLTAAPNLLMCEVAFSATTTSQVMTMISSSDASITVANGIHFNFGPRGFNVSVRKDSDTFDSIMTGTWREAVPCDGATTRRYALSVRNNTLKVTGPNGEEWATDDVRVGLLTGTLPIWEPNKSGTEQAFLTKAWAVVRDGTRRPSPYHHPADSAAGGFATDALGRVVGSKGTAYEVAVGYDNATGLGSIEFGPASAYPTTLQSGAAATATSIVTDKWIPTGSTIQIESGTNKETVTASGNSTGSYPTYTTAVSALTKTHAAGVGLSVTVPAAFRWKLTVNQGTPTLTGSNVIMPTNVFWPGQTLKAQEVLPGVFYVGGSAGAGKGTIMPGRVTTAGRPTAAAVGQGGMLFDTTLNKPIWSTGSAFVDASGAAV